jgi:hypothetical protein
MSGKVNKSTGHDVLQCPKVPVDVIHQYQANIVSIPASKDKWHSFVPIAIYFSVLGLISALL